MAEFKIYEGNPQLTPDRQQVGTDALSIVADGLKQVAKAQVKLEKARSAEDTRRVILDNTNNNIIYSDNVKTIKANALENGMLDNGTMIYNYDGVQKDVSGQSAREILNYVTEGRNAEGAGKYGTNTDAGIKYMNYDNQNRINQRDDVTVLDASITGLKAKKDMSDFNIMSVNDMTPFNVDTYLKNSTFFYKTLKGSGISEAQWKANDKKNINSGLLKYFADEMVNAQFNKNEQQRHPADTLGDLQELLKEVDLRKELSKEQRNEIKLKINDDIDKANAAIETVKGVAQAETGKKYKIAMDTRGIADISKADQTICDESVDCRAKATAYDSQQKALRSKNKKTSEVDIQKYQKILNNKNSTLAAKEQAKSDIEAIRKVKADDKNYLSKQAIGKVHLVDESAERMWNDYQAGTISRVAYINHITPILNKLNGGDRNIATPEQMAQIKNAKDTNAFNKILDSVLFNMVMVKDDKGVARMVKGDELSSKAQRDFFEQLERAGVVSKGGAEAISLNDETLRRYATNLTHNIEEKTKFLEKKKGDGSTDLTDIQTTIDANIIRNFPAFSTKNFRVDRVDGVDTLIRDMVIGTLIDNPFADVAKVTTKISKVVMDDFFTSATIAGKPILLINGTFEGRIDPKNFVGAEEFIKLMDGGIDKKALKGIYAEQGYVEGFLDAIDPALNDILDEFWPSKDATKFDNTYDFNIKMSPDATGFYITTRDGSKIIPLNSDIYPNNVIPYTAVMKHPSFEYAEELKHKDNTPWEWGE